jgi:hypothetical protein
MIAVIWQLLAKRMTIEDRPKMHQPFHSYDKAHNPKLGRVKFTQFVFLTTNIELEVTTSVVSIFYLRGKLRCFVK